MGKEKYVTIWREPKAIDIVHEIYGEAVPDSVMKSLPYIKPSKIEADYRAILNTYKNRFPSLREEKIVRMAKDTLAKSLQTFHRQRRYWRSRLDKDDIKGAEKALQEYGQLMELFYRGENPLGTLLPFLQWYGIIYRHYKVVNEGNITMRKNVLAGMLEATDFSLDRLEGMAPINDLSAQHRLIEVIMQKIVQPWIEEREEFHGLPLLDRVERALESRFNPTILEIRNKGLERIQRELGRELP